MVIKKSEKHKIKFSLLHPVFYVSCFAFCFSLPAQAAILYVEPGGGTFTVGSTFDVSLFLNTEGESINTLATFLSFPSDKLQLVSPSAGKSIISLWTSPPKFNNASGLIELQGGIPGGINASKGLVTNLTFRVKSIGAGVLKFLDESKVLLNDGLGTDVLKQAQNGIYNFVLPPPAGPLVASETHPEQSQWYQNRTIILTWLHDNEVDGYSYVLNNELIDIPDDISEGTRTTVAYKGMADGEYYFHIKALRNGRWGGVTHFAARIDSSPPAEFAVKVSPSSRTDNSRPVIDFITTDNLSGISHYELKVISLKKTTEANETDYTKSPMFIEVERPFVFSQDLGLGTYDIVVRAHDNAGNYREETKRLAIVSPVFSVIGDRGISVKGIVVIPWFWFLFISAALLAFFGYLAWYLKKKHYSIESMRVKKQLPVQIRKQFEELKEYRKRYGNILVMVVFLGTLLSLFCCNGVFAQETELDPPVITAISRNISNEEIFYIGGQSEKNSAIIIYLQNLKSGETLSWNVNSDEGGEWFYRHNSFLSSGNYILWVQAKALDQMSPPSPQVTMSVRDTALQFGSSRISYETLYLILVILLAIALLGLIIYTSFHGYHARKKHHLFMKEVREAEEAIRRGFAILHRDVEAELAVIKKAKLNKELSTETEEKERRLLEDLSKIEKYIGKEVLDIEDAEYFR